MSSFVSSRSGRKAAERLTWLMQRRPRILRVLHGARDLRGALRDMFGDG